MTSPITTAMNTLPALVALFDELQADGEVDTLYHSGLCKYYASKVRQIIDGMKVDDALAEAAAPFERLLQPHHDR